MCGSLLLLAGAVVIVVTFGLGIDSADDDAPKGNVHPLLFKLGGDVAFVDKPGDGQGLGELSGRPSR